jgi:hypothetical protein
MSTAVYSIRLESDVRRIMDEMSDVDWQAEIRQMVETIVRDKKKKRLLARAEARWQEQVANDKGAASMIREDRDAR